MFDSLFQRECVMTGDQLARAPPQHVQKHLAKLALKRHMPPTRRNGVPWTGYQVLSPSARGRVRRHEAFVKRTATHRPRLVCNVCQNPQRYAGTEKIPALLRRSQLWSMHLQRLLTPLEHFEVQGYPMFPTAGEPAARCSRALRTLSDRDLLSLAGNGMHASCIGISIMFLLALTEVQRDW